MLYSALVVSSRAEMYDGGYLSQRILVTLSLTRPVVSVASHASYLEILRRFVFGVNPVYSVMV